MAYIEFKNVEKIYKMGEVDLKALDKASFEIEKRELVVILGQSGSGKSTCLNILGGMDEVTSGTVIVDGIDITKLENDNLTYDFTISNICENYIHDYIYYDCKYWGALCIKENKFDRVFKECRIIINKVG